MFSASFLISYAEGLSADDQAVLLADLEGLAAELSDVFIAGEVLDIGGLMNQGDIMLEIATTSSAPSLWTTAAPQTSRATTP